MGLLYRLTSPSGKSYIGITSKDTIYQRWKTHVGNAKHGKKSALYSAIRKYGPDRFTVEILKEIVDWDRLNSMEEETILRLNTLYPNGYNSLSGGSQVIHSKTSIEKISKALREKWKDPEYRSRQHMSRLGHKNLLGQKRSISSRKKMSEARRGKRLSDNTKNKLSTICKTKWKDPEYREMMLKARLKGKNSVIV